MCDFENALMCYKKGFGLRFPYKNMFLDGYYRTLALLYNITNGTFPVFYGGNMRVFYRLVQGQERGGGQKIFNDTYKHYDELFPLEPNLAGLQEEINMFHVNKPPPPDHVHRRIKKAAVQQLVSAKKILGGFWDYKLEVEKHLIKKEFAIPHTGPKDRTEHIERALQFLKRRMDRFEVVCSILKNNELRKFDKRIDWLSEYGKWMATDKVPSSIPPAKTSGLATSRYRWALSQTLFDMRNKTLDVCWVRSLKRERHSHHLFSKRRPWRYYLGYRSAKEGALAAIRNRGGDWNFMQNLYDNVLKNVETHAPADGRLPPPKHIRDIGDQIDEYEKKRKVAVLAPQLVMPVSKSEQKDKLYYDPEHDVDKWDNNRDMLRQSILKREDRPGFIPTPDPNAIDARPIPANLLEVFETRVHDEPDAWDRRRKLSRDLRESLAKAEAARAVQAHVADKRPMFAVQATAPEDGKGKGKDDKNEHEADSLEDMTSKSQVSMEPADQSPAEAPAEAVDDEEMEEQAPKKEPKVRRPGPRHKYDILDKKSEVDYLFKPRIKRRSEKTIDKQASAISEILIDEDAERAAAQQEAERMLAARAEDPFEISRRQFDNQKALYLEKAYNALMSCTKPNEFAELEVEIAELMDAEFPPKTMRYPNGEPITLKGYPPPAPMTKPPISEYFANRNKPKPKKKGGAAAAEKDRKESAKAVDLGE
ncbi:uncharacterized protein LOC129586863 isoform X2 [Paramacrobiotus metropolitanus]|nr:uncharacterized protein LOC129586863 isoform X2 [Paramacrobiotus metropolitanus]